MPFEIKDEMPQRVLNCVINRITDAADPIWRPSLSRMATFGLAKNEPFRRSNTFTLKLAKGSPESGGPI